MSDGLAYTVRDQQAQTAANDLIQITAPADAVVVLDAIKVSQDALTAVEFLRLTLTRASAAGTGGALTPQATQVGFPAAGSTVLRNSTTNATPSGAPLVDEQWNALAPFHWHPTAQERIVISPSGILVLILNTAPSASTNVDVYIAFRELGG